jgi:hypothetical protein
MGFLNLPKSVKKKGKIQTNQSGAGDISFVDPVAETEEVE